VKLYLAGPMRGRPEFNFPAFDRAEAQLRDMGHDVFSPAARDREHGFTAEGLTGDEDLAALGFDLRDALAVDLEWITRHADAVIVLPGWEGSSGARAEVATAKALGLPVHELVAFDLYGERAPDVTETAPDGLGFIDRALGEVRTVSATGGEKGRKPCEVGAVDPLAREELGKVAGFGARKYDRGNYLKGYDWSLCVDALHRHMLAFESGEDRDPESGLLHVAHAAWHGLALASFVLRGIGTDDRSKA
jgi:hypothetical protein